MRKIEEKEKEKEKEKERKYLKVVARFSTSKRDAEPCP